MWFPKTLPREYPQMSKEWRAYSVGIGKGLSNLNFWIELILFLFCLFIYLFLCFVFLKFIFISQCFNWRFSITWKPSFLSLIININSSFQQTAYLIWRGVIRTLRGWALATNTLRRMLKETGRKLQTHPALPNALY